MPSLNQWKGEMTVEKILRAISTNVCGQESNPVPLTSQSDAMPTALRGPAPQMIVMEIKIESSPCLK